MRPKIAVFVDAPRVSIESANGIIRAVESWADFRIFSVTDLYPDFFDDVDLIAVPGGIGSSDTFDRRLRWNKQPVQEFVARGGAYLGICMGAYWADAYYFDLLNDIRVVQYIKSPGADTRRPHPKAQLVNWQGQTTRMYFYDGCTFTGSGSSTIYATYPNGMPMAIIQNRIGLIGCHPESDSNWYDRKYLKPHWHNYQHDQLLSNFAQAILGNNHGTIQTNS